jgi:hypothetical protein
MLSLNKNSNKNCFIKKKYLIQKIEITLKRLEIGIHKVNKSGLKLNFTFISSMRNGSGHLKKLSFRHFLIINFELLQ